MRRPLLPEVEKNRVVVGILASTSTMGNNGAFHLSDGKHVFNVIVSDGMGWEHVSVTLRGQPQRTPTWDEMCWIKNLFWGPEEVVVQFHPAEDEYVNVHPYCLHLWKPTTFEIRTPPTEMIGMKPKRRDHGKR